MIPGAPKAIDLFSGPGGLTLGLKLAGYQVIAAVEVDELAAYTYQRNHPEIRIYREDIRRLDPVAVLDQLGLRPGDLGLLAGCPPCQGFSTVRTRNRPGSVADERNDLILDYVRFVREMRPKSILLENVPGLADDWRLDCAVEELERLGYPAEQGVRVLNAADHGVPQRRRRLVLLSGQDTVLPFPEPASRRRTVRDAIEGMPPAGGSGDPLHDFPERRSPEVMAIIRRIPHDGGGRLDLGPDQQLRCHRDFTGFKDIYGRMAWDAPAPTITGGCHNPSKGRFLHPKEDRAITLREAALLQGFPPRYFFSLSRGKLRAAAMIGNALPPAFIRAHAEPVRDTLSQ